MSYPRAMLKLKTPPTPKAKLDLQRAPWHQNTPKAKLHLQQLIWN